MRVAARVQRRRRVRRTLVNVPAGSSNLELIKKSFERLPEWVTECFFRADSACYEDEVLKWLAGEAHSDRPSRPIGFTISADVSTQLRALCEAVCEADDRGASDDSPRWRLLDDTRASETVDVAEVEFAPGNWHKNAKPLRYLVIRFQKRQGLLYADGSTKRYLAVVTNREGDARELVRWHWLKAGSIEHVHDQTKNELGAGVLPCAKFGANAAWYRLSMIAFNVMTMVKRLALPADEQAAKPKRVRFLVFELAGRITAHARRLIVQLTDAVLSRVNLLSARAALRAIASGDPPPPLPA